MSFDGWHSLGGAVSYVAFEYSGCEEEEWEMESVRIFHRF